MSWNCESFKEIIFNGIISITRKIKLDWNVKLDRSRHQHFTRWNQFRKREKKKTNYIPVESRSARKACNEVSWNLFSAVVKHLGREEKKNQERGDKLFVERSERATLWAREKRKKEKSVWLRERRDEYMRKTSWSPSDLFSLGVLLMWLAHARTSVMRLNET